MALSTLYNRMISTLNKYEQQGQRLYSQNWSDEYKENYEKIFGKKETWLERRERLEKEQKEKDDNCTD